MAAPETGMTKLGGSKRKRSSSGDGNQGKLVLEVVEPAVDEPDEKANKNIYDQLILIGIFIEFCPVHSSDSSVKQNSITL